MIINQIIQFVQLHYSEIVLFLTFCAVCWYSWETRRLVASTNESIRMAASSTFLASCDEQMNKLNAAANWAAKPEILGFEMGELAEMKDKAKKILYSYFK